LTSIGFKRWPSVVGPALLFVFFHWFFYQYNMKLPNRGDLEWTALATLLFLIVLGRAVWRCDGGAQNVFGSAEPVTTSGEAAAAVPAAQQSGT